MWSILVLVWINNQFCMGFIKIITLMTISVGPLWSLINWTWMTYNTFEYHPGSPADHLTLNFLSCTQLLVIFHMTPLHGSRCCQSPSQVVAGSRIIWSYKPITCWHYCLYLQCIASLAVLHRKVRIVSISSRLQATRVCLNRLCIIVLCITLASRKQNKIAKFF